MKKIFAIVAFAAICIAASAQELVTYTGSEFIVQHPAEFKGEEDVWGAGANEWKMDDNHLLTCWYDEDACKVVEFDMYAAVQKIGMEDKGMTCGDPVIKGNICTLRGVKDNQVEYAYVVNFGIKTYSECLTGKFRCLVSDEAKYKPMFDTILSTMKLK